jgi:beta-1,4-N-acetylglucosaminyltransferase
MNSNPKICIVSSCGGHLTEIRALKSFYEKYNYFYILNCKITLPKDMEEKTYFIDHSERDWRTLVNLWQAWCIFRREKPDLIISTGAGPIVPLSLVGKLFGIPTIFIETCARINYPSLTGRMMYYLADKFYYQWKSLGNFFPKGIYTGPLI